MSSLTSETADCEGTNNTVSTYGTFISSLFCDFTLILCSIFHSLEVFVSNVIIKQPALAIRLTTRQIIIIKIICEGFRTANMLQEKKNKMMNNNLFITIIIIIYSLPIGCSFVMNPFMTSKMIPWFHVFCQMRH